MRLRLLFTLFLPLLASCSYLPDEQDVPDVVQVYEYRDYIELNPTSNHYSKTGLVFYPGGLVDPHAYIEPLTQFVTTGKGHKVVIVKMPGNLALLDTKKGAFVFEDFPSVEQWVVAGHSLGGVMACSLVEKYPDWFKGLILMAAYPSETTNLSEWKHPVLSIRGQYDGLVDSLTIASNVGHLPTPYWIRDIADYPGGTVPKTVYYTIPGANHSQFGNYGVQEGDGIPTITREEQTANLTLLMYVFFVVNELEYDIFQ